MFLGTEISARRSSSEGDVATLRAAGTYGVRGSKGMGRRAVMLGARLVVDGDHGAVGG